MLWFATCCRVADLVIQSSLSVGGSPPPSNASEFGGTRIATRVSSSSPVSTLGTYRLYPLGLEAIADTGEAVPSQKEKIGAYGKVFPRSGSGRRPDCCSDSFSRTLPVEYFGDSGEVGVVSRQLIFCRILAGDLLAICRIIRPSTRKTAERPACWWLSVRGPNKAVVADGCSCGRRRGLE